MKLVQNDTFKCIETHEFIWFKNHVLLKMISRDIDFVKFIMWLYHSFRNRLPIFSSIILSLLKRTLRPNELAYRGLGIIWYNLYPIYFRSTSDLKPESISSPTPIFILNPKPWIFLFKCKYYFCLLVHSCQLINICPPHPLVELESTVYFDLEFYLI